MTGSSLSVLTNVYACCALSVDEIQAACYKILDSAYLMNTLTATTTPRKTIHYELEKYVFLRIKDLEKVEVRSESLQKKAFQKNACLTAEFANVYCLI